MKVPEQSILEKTLNNEATADEAREVVRWLATPEGQNWLSTRMDADAKVIHKGEEESFIDHPIPSAAMYQTVMQQIRRQQIRRWIFRAAAVLIPVMLFIGLFLHVDSRVDLLADDEYDEVYVPKGEQMQLMFQDGSKVFLNSESRIRYPRKFSLLERKVQLEGEAWFEVAKNRNRPFTVDLTCVKIQVLGTTFDVKAYPKEDISVALQTGSVELKASTFKTFMLKPGEKAIYNRTSGHCKIIHPEDIRLSSAWTKKILVFRNAPLSEVTTTLNRTYNVTFIIEDSLALNYNYTLISDSTRLPFVLRELEKITPVRFEEKEGIIKVNLKK